MRCCYHHHHHHRWASNWHIKWNTEEQQIGWGWEEEKRNTRKIFFAAAKDEDTESRPPYFKIQQHNTLFHLLVCIILSCNNTQVFSLYFSLYSYRFSFMFDTYLKRARVTSNRTVLLLFTILRKSTLLVLRIKGKLVKKSSKKRSGNRINEYVEYRLNGMKEERQN